MVEPGESIGWVSSAYLGVLIPWTFLHVFDFISERWKSVRVTWRYGILHILTILFLMPLIIYYVYLQARLSEPDYKEMFTAITALALSLYHLFRGLWGLVQLQHFRKWATDAAIALELAGYHVQRPKKNIQATKQTENLQRFMKMEKIVRSTRSFRRDSAQTAQKGDKDAFWSCFFSSCSDECGSKFTIRSLGRCMSTASQRRDDCIRSNVDTSCGTCWRSVKNASFRQHRAEEGISLDDRKRIATFVEEMKVNNFILDNELVSSRAPNVAACVRGLRIFQWLSQRDPVEERLTTFIRWSVAFLAQCGNEWLRDLAASTRFQSEEGWAEKRRGWVHDAVPSTQVDRRRWKVRRQEFAQQVLATASLRMGNASGHSGSMHSHRSYLSPHVWREITPMGTAQVFSRRKAATRAFRGKRCMPCQNPVLQSSRDRLPNPRFYTPLIREAIEALHPKLYEEIEKFGRFYPTHIEWFAAFLWSKYASTPRSDSGATEEEKRTAVMSTENSQSLGDEGFAETDTPVRLLRNQLGFGSGYSGPIELDRPVTLKRLAYPFIPRVYKKLLWDHRSILEVSARIDNWLALQAGSQISFLLERESRILPSRKSFEAAHSDNWAVAEERQESLDGPLPKNGDKKPSERIFLFHSRLEMQQLQSQLVDANTAHGHMEQGLSFLGCVTETVRSVLAEQVYVRTVDREAWCPKISEEEITIPVSRELWRCGFTPLLRGKAQLDSSIEERLLWECQQGAYHSLKRKLATRFASLMEAHRLAESMMLMVMGYPSIRIRRARRTGQFAIRAVGAPQALAINVTFHVSQGASQTTECEEPSVTLRLFPSESVFLFRWQDWRDALEGRLEGKSKWLKSHYLHLGPSQTGHTTETIASPVESLVMENARWEEPSLVWRGWKPFRAEMALFELKHLCSRTPLYPSDAAAMDWKSRLLLNTAVHEDRTVTNDEAGRVETVRAATEAYEDEDAYTPASLSEKMLRLDTALKLGQGLYQWGKGLPGRLEERDTPPLHTPATGHSMSHVPSNNLPRVQDNNISPGSRTSSSRVPSGNVANSGSTAGTVSGMDRSHALSSLLQTRQVTIRTPSTPSTSSVSKSSPTPHTSRKPGESGRTESTNRRAPEKGKLVEPIETDPQKLLDKAESLDLVAMHHLAFCLLNGSNGFRKQPEHAYPWMQRALFIGRRIDTANLMVDIFLSNSEGVDDFSKFNENIERAAYAVELLWLDVEARHRLHRGSKTARTADIDEVRKWQAEASMEEKERLDGIIALHKRVVKRRATGDTLLDLADRLSNWGLNREHEELAIELYETAIIISLDVVSMIKLALLLADRSFDKSNGGYASALLDRAKKLTSKRLRNEPKSSTIVDVDQYLRDLEMKGERGARSLVATDIANMVRPSVVSDVRIEVDDQA